MQHYDVVIIGGGLVGTSAALAIYKAKPELKIAVVEAFATPEKLPPSFDDRCIAFSQQSVEYMQSLGLFDTQWPFNQAIQKK